MPIPSEPSLTKTKLYYAAERGTEVKEFRVDGISGVYCTDPLQLMQTLMAQKAPPWLCMGGDCGNGQTKLGVSHPNGDSDTRTFTPFVMYFGSDDYESSTTAASCSSKVTPWGRHPSSFSSSP